MSTRLYCDNEGKHDRRTCERSEVKRKTADEKKAFSLYRKRITGRWYCWSIRNPAKKKRKAE